MHSTHCVGPWPLHAQTELERRGEPGAVPVCWCSSVLGTISSKSVDLICMAEHTLPMGPWSCNVPWRFIAGDAGSAVLAAIGGFESGDEPPEMT